MGGLGSVGKKVTSFMEKIDPVTKLRNKAMDKIGLPTEKNLFEDPETPELEATTVIPTADSEQIAASKRRRTAEQMSRSGRQSTILSDRLGG